MLADTQERFYQYYEDRGSFDFQGFPFEPGDVGNPAIVQKAVDFLAGAENPAIYFAVQAADCVAFIGPARRRRRSRDLDGVGCDDETVRACPRAKA